MQQKGSYCEFTGGDSWVVLSAIELSIKRKIESVGKPLKDWDINIYRGVLTGYNDAFIISTQKRDEILSNCKTVEERKRTEDIIRPILRGRDIKRYGYEWAELYLIATFPARHYDIEKYPAVKQHLLSFAYNYLIENNNAWVAEKYLADFCKQKLAQTGEYVVINGKSILDSDGKKEKARKRTSNKWFETQDNISYWEDFYKPKLFYADITQKLNFCLCNEVMFCNNTTYFISTENEDVLEHLYSYLNAPIVDWYYRTLSVQLGEKAVRMFSIYVLDIPVPPLGIHDYKSVFGLTPEEITFLEDRE